MTDLFTRVVSISLELGRAAPIAFTWVPRETELPLKSGTGELVAKTRTSDFLATSSADVAELTGTLVLLEALRTNAVRWAVDRE